MINFTEDIESSYKNLINSIESVFKTKLEEFDNISQEDIITNCDKFYNLLNDDRLYLLFLNNKIKVFSSKDALSNELSNSLFNDNLLLKNIFNNQDEMNKLILWDSLLHLYFSIETCNQNRLDRLNELNNKFNQIKVKLSEHVKEQILPDDINNSTTNMVSDIIGSFQDLVSDNKNPFENIMGITTKISEKYYKDIEDGNIEVDKLLKNMPFPGKEQGMNMEEMMNGDLMKNMGDMMGNVMGGEMGDMMKGMMGEKEEKKQTVIDDNFSTADVEVGEDELEKKGKGMIGNMMNMANNLPSMDSLGGLGGLGEIGGMMKDLTSGGMDLDNLENMKGKMDNFMEKTLGVDMSEFNKNMENLVTKMEDNKNIETGGGEHEHEHTSGVNSLD
tara:strand:- start:1841 stop:3004 length:1164 start_codon:yes stop_codon:yes gene_type:complete